MAYSFDTIQDYVGKELGVSNWVQIDQERVNQFADCTGDHQWIHIDAEKAEKYSPFGTTIAHGYLTLSLLPMLTGELGVIPSGVSQVFNYGTDKVRFLSPVKVGARIRNRAVLMSAQEKGPGRVLIKVQNTMEIEGEDKPAMVAETLAMALLA
ncbi:MAG: MaoC family dehydratase [Chloroflexota bacterium]